MKMPLTLEEHESTRSKRLDEEMAARQLFQRIFQARAKRMRAMREQQQEQDGVLSEEEHEKEKQVRIWSERVVLHS